MFGENIKRDTTKGLAPGYYHSFTSKNSFIQYPKYLYSWQNSMTLTTTDLPSLMPKMHGFGFGWVDINPPFQTPLIDNAEQLLKHLLAVG